MKVLFVFAYKPSDTWTTPISLKNQFKDTSVVSLFNERNEYRTSDELYDLLSVKLVEGYDALIYMDFGQVYHGKMWKQLKSQFPSVVFVCECGDDPQNQSKNEKNLPYFDIAWTPDHESYLYYTRTYPKTKILFITHFADIALAHPHIKVNVYNRAVSTRGYGSSYVLDGLSMIGLVENKNVAAGREHHNFLAQSLITVQHSRFGEITRRIFEAAAAGSLVITDRLSDAKQMKDLGFIEDENIVYYDNIVDCASKIIYYKHHTEEARKIAKEGQNLVLTNYTSFDIATIIHEEIYNVKSKC